MGLGIVVVVEKENVGCKIVCVIGDGVIIVGMVFEVLNYVGVLYIDMLVILNDNEMLIFENVGVLNNYFVCIFLGLFYIIMCDGSKKILDKVLIIKNFMKKSEEYMKGVIFLFESMLFEEFGFNYIGLIDGYNIDDLVKMLENMCDLKGL